MGKAHHDRLGGSLNTAHRAYEALLDRNDNLAFARVVAPGFSRTQPLASGASCLCGSAHCGIEARPLGKPSR